VRVYVYPADLSGCGQYRLIFVSKALQAQGHDVHIVVPKGRSTNVGLNGLQDQDGHLVDVTIPPDADVMVLQRPTLGQLAQAVPMIRAKGVAVVIDMDDDLSCVHPANPAWHMMHPTRGRPGHSWHNATQACMDATLVTTSTQALLKTYAPHGRGVVLENCVPASYLDVPRSDSDVIGWGGSVHSHPDDLQMVGMSIGRLVGDGRRFTVVGEGTGVASALGLAEDPPATGYREISDWPAALAGLGVGIAPLADTRFNGSKSRLKILEYSSLGIPWVGSPRAEYRRMHLTHGVGLLADKPRDWYRHLSTLTSSPTRRVEMSEHGREVAAEMTIEGNSWRWLAAWEMAYKAQRHAASPVSFRV
jgi:glycosyltransferase involved in cell wall biosynthesis